MSGGELFGEQAANLPVLSANEGRSSEPPSTWEMDWVEGPTIVVEEKPAIAVYTDSRGGTVVRQQADWNVEEDSIVIRSTREVAAAVISGIKREIGCK